MKLKIKPDENRLQVFHEGRKRRIFVGELIYVKDKDRFELIYDKDYTLSSNAIPISPDLSLFKLRHQSKKGELFPVFIDRIPVKSNPAYKDYCLSQGISPNETNPIILLGTIGRRGPSSFVFESVYHDAFNPVEITNLRELLEISQHDLAEAFDISKPTLQRIESGASQDPNTLKRLQILFEFPDVALWQLKQTGGRLHREVLAKLIKYFESKYTEK